MGTNDIGDWYRNIPQISRYWFTGSVALPLMGKLGIFSPMAMILHFQMFIYKFQIWRPLTALLYYPITPQTGFHYLINLYFLYSYSTRLETGGSWIGSTICGRPARRSTTDSLLENPAYRMLCLQCGVFYGKPADYAFMLIFNWICLVIIGLIGEMMLLMDAMILSVLYVWCQVNRDQIVQFWFGTQFKAMYLPWVLVAFNMVIRGGGFGELIGILVGHLYFFLKFKYPQDFGGQVFLTTPSILYKYLPSTSGGMGGFGATAARRPPAQAGRDGRHAWGRGNTLGNN